MEKAVFSRRYFVDCPEAERKEDYQRFLEFVFGYADGFTLSYQKPGFKAGAPGLDDFQSSRWGYLAESVYDYECTNESPVTTGPPVLLLYFRFDDVTKKFLRERTDIYDFGGYEIKSPNTKGWNARWLWDLALLKEGKIFCISCTHERFCEIDEDVLTKFRQA